MNLIYFNSNILVITIIILSTFSLFGTFDSVYANHIFNDNITITGNDIKIDEYDPDGDGFTDVTWDVIITESSNTGDVILDIICPSLSDFTVISFSNVPPPKDIHANGGLFAIGIYLIYCDFIYLDGTSQFFVILLQIFRSDVLWEFTGDATGTLDSPEAITSRIDFKLTGTIAGVVYSMYSCSIIKNYDLITLDETGGYFPVGDSTISCYIIDSDGEYFYTSLLFTVLPYEELVVEVLDLEIILESEPKILSGGGCNDCTPPTLGIDKNFNRIINNGFSYNGNIVKVENWYTSYPLINATVGEMNLVEIIVYENGGINNMERVQFGLGAENIGQSLSTLEVLVDIELETFGTLEDIAVKEIIITDKDNLIDNDTVSASTHVVKCQNDSLVDHCVKIDLQYSYREATFNHIMVVNVADKKHNSQNFWFNDGIQVIGESLNEPTTFVMHNKKTNQQTDDIFLTLTLVDKFTDIWVDKYGIEYLKVRDNTFTRITPLEKETCDNTPYSIVTNPDRRSCQFKLILASELDRVTKLAQQYYKIN